MTYQESVLITEAQVFESQISNKFITTYGKIKEVSSDGKTCDVTHMDHITYNGEDYGPIVSKKVELLYIVSSELSIKMAPKVGDGVLLIGLRSLVISTDPENLTPAKPLTYDSYNLSTLKAIPLSAINSGSGVTIQAKSSKLSIKNEDETLATILSDFMDKVVAIATAPKVLTPTDIICAGPGAPATGTIPSTTISSSSQSDINAIKTRLLKLLEP